MVVGVRCSVLELQYKVTDRWECENLNTFLSVRNFFESIAFIACKLCRSEGSLQHRRVSLLSFVLFTSQVIYGSHLISGVDRAALAVLTEYWVHPVGVKKDVMDLPRGVRLYGIQWNHVFPYAVCSPPPSHSYYMNMHM